MTPHEIKNTVDVVILVEDGRASEVFASDKDSISIEIIDCDTDDAEREREIQEEVGCLNTRISSGELYAVY